MEVVAELEKVELLFDSLWLFGSIAKNVELRFEPELLYIIASQKSPQFLATLQISRFSFFNYFIDHAVQIPGLQLSIDSFYDDLLEFAQVSTALSMHLMIKSQKLALKFHEPSDITDLRPRVRVLNYLPAKGGDEDLGVVDAGNRFKIVSSELRRIIKQLPLFQHHSVCVLVSNSEVKFSVGSEEIVVTVESGNCEIEGFEVETEFQVVFLPMLFFIDLTYKSKLIWFFKKLYSDCSVVVPFDDEDDDFKVEYVIHFSQM